MSDNNSQINGLQNDRAYSQVKAAVTAVINKNVDPALQIRGFKGCPKDIEEQNALGVELVEFTCNPEIYDIEEFPLSRRMNPYRFYKMAKTNEFFAECLQTATYLCALHLKKAAYSSTIPSNIMLALLPTLNPEYREFIVEKVTKKIESYIKAQQTFTCTWLNDLAKEATITESPEKSNERTQTDQSIPTEGISEEIPESSVR